MSAAEKDFSLNVDAPAFYVVANAPGITERAIEVGLRTSHPSKPNFLMTGEEDGNPVTH